MKRFLSNRFICFSIGHEYYEHGKKKLDGNNNKIISVHPSRTEKEKLIRKRK